MQEVGSYKACEQSLSDALSCRLISSQPPATDMDVAADPFVQFMPPSSFVLRGPREGVINEGVFDEKIFVRERHRVWCLVWTFVRSSGTDCFSAHHASGPSRFWRRRSKSLALPSLERRLGMWRRLA
jgi:hypothetical protein